MFVFKSKLPDYSAHMNAIKEIKILHSSYKYKSLFCYGHDCVCCGSELCKECGSIYPCDTIKVIEEHDV